jgi:stearoyl-CoA desaturase (Delta-9 desaturase)
MEQNTLLDWVPMHLVHHKYAETDADPHDSRRGFFFSHFGWVITEEHPEYKRRLAEIDTSYLLKDPIIVYQHK